MARRGKHPILHTDRLTLRSFAAKDAERLKRLAGDEAVIDTMMSLPHPLDDEQAMHLIRTRSDAYHEGKGVHFAVALKDTDELIGAVGIQIHEGEKPTKLNYWIGKEYWARGYCTEAVAAAVRFAFERLPIESISALHFSRNVASGRVMQKIGMVHKKHMPRRAEYRGRFEDLELYVITREDLPDI